MSADTPTLIQQQTASASNSRPLLQSHSPNFIPNYQQQEQRYAMMGTNPLDPFNLFGPRNPFGWYIPNTSPPRAPATRFLPLEIPSVEDVEKAVINLTRQIEAFIFDLTCLI